MTLKDEAYWFSRWQGGMGFIVGINLSFLISVPKESLLELATIIQYLVSSVGFEKVHSESSTPNRFFCFVWTKSESIFSATEALDWFFIVLE